MLPIKLSIAIVLCAGFAVPLYADEPANSSKEKSMKFANPSQGYVIRRGKERGFFDHGWLKTYHTFSFADYHDPDFMGFRSLRVINEDTVSPGKGFPTHAHNNMEILTVVLEGAIAHKDSMENERVVHEHEIQAMSAGTSVTHSEYNPSKSKKSHFLQIWITPDQKGIKPRYQQTNLPQKENEWVLLASKTGENGSLQVQQDVKVYMLTLTPGHEMKKDLDSDRYGWIQVIEGTIQFNKETLHPGDGVALDHGTAAAFSASRPAKILFFDLN